MAVTEKRNNSNNPNETQPTLSDGTYTFKNGGGDVSEGAESGAVLGLDAAWDDDDLEEFGSDIADDANWDDDDLEEFAEGMDDDADFDGKVIQTYFDNNTDKFVFRENVGYLDMSQEEAKRNADSIILEIIKRYPSVSLKNFNFKDQRTKLAYVDAISKILCDWPELGKFFNDPIVNFEFKDENFAEYGKKNNIYGFGHAAACCGNTRIMVSNNNGMAASSTAEETVAYWNPESFSYVVTREEKLRYNIIHELGHAFQNMIYFKGSFYQEYSNKNEFQSMIKRKIIEEAKKHYKDKNKSFYPSFDESLYGSVDDGEWFAETFASAYSSAPTKTAEFLREWMEKNKNMKSEKAIFFF